VAVCERPPLEPLQVSGLFAGHLAVQDLDAIETPLGRQVDALLDVAQLLVAELPEGVRADGNGTVPLCPRRRLSGAAPRRTAHRSDAERTGGGSYKQLATIHGWLLEVDRCARAI
jgi:hypothetical protein